MEHRLRWVIDGSETPGATVATALGCNHMVRVTFPAGNVWVGFTPMLALKVAWMIAKQALLATVR